MKRFLTIILGLCLVLPISVSAAESGTVGENITWSFDGETLTVTGSGDGKMADFTAKEDAPWYGCKDQIQKLVLVDVYYIGAHAFQDYDGLTQINFGSKLYEVGEQAFKGCDGLENLTMPESFKIFGPESFRGCKNLQTITCLGRFPSFRLNCLWDVYVKILYPKENAYLWPEDTIHQLEANFNGRLEFLTTDLEDLAPPVTTPPETTPQPTTPPPTTPAPTTPAPTTPAPTVSVPVVTQPAPTTPAPTTPAPTTPAPTQPPQSSQPEAKDTSRQAWTGVAIILGVISTGGMLAGGISIYKNNRRKKQRRNRW